jgi:hypothetical protein
MIARKLWSDDHNYIKFIIKVDSLVKLGDCLFSLLSLSYPCSYPFSMINFMSLTFLTDQMVNTRSGSGVEQAAVPRQETSHSTNPDPQQSNSIRRHLQGWSSFSPPRLSYLATWRTLSPTCRLR